MPLSDSERSAILAKAIDKIFGPLKDWKRTEVLHTFGANNLDLVDEFEAKLATSLAKFAGAIKELSDSSLIELSEQISNAYRISENDLVSRIASEVGARNLSPPPDTAYGFGHPSFAVDFGYWGKMSKLGLDQLAVLSVGANPDVIDEKKIEALSKAKGKGDRLWAAFEYLLKQKEVFSGYFHFTGWGYAQMPLAKIKALIDEVEIEVHPDFYSSLEKRFGAKKAKDTATESKPMTSQERDTLLRLVAAMACEQYGYDPSKERSAVAASIRDDIEAIGQSMDGKTIRKWLKESVVFVDKDYWRSKD